MGAEVFCKCMPKIACKYSLGLSATPKRKDGMNKVFEWYLGTIAYMSKDKNEDYVEVRIIKYMCENTLYNQIPLSYMKKPCVPKMINNICNFKPRRKLLIDTILPLNVEGRSILILSDRRNHLEYIHDELQKMDIERSSTEMQYTICLKYFIFIHINYTYIYYFINLFAYTT